jgi:two-component system, cell cycle response regulator
VPHNHYLVDVIGFNPTERSMLSSIFALAARRDPGFRQYDPVAQNSPHLYLVDVDNPTALAEFRALNGQASLPAVLVGSCQEEEGSVVVARPVQWARLIQAMEEAVDAGEETQPAPLESGAENNRSGRSITPHSITPRPLAPQSNAPNSIPRPITPRPTTAQSITGGAAARTPRPGSVPPAEEVKSALGDAVLVVDDNATVRMFMQAKLAPFKFEVDFAESGEQAIGLTGAREYACIFLDVVLPGIDGYQVCKLIKSNKQAIKKTAVVMLTSRSSPFDKLRGSLAGCDEYLTKPLDEERLLAVIAKFLPSGRKRAERSMHR